MPKSYPGASDVSNCSGNFLRSTYACWRTNVLGTLYSVGDFDRNTAFFPPPPPSTAPQPPPPVATDGPAPPPPPPPPGPPPPVTYCAPPPATGSILPTPESAFQLRSVAPVAQKKRESRGDLLLSIRAGMSLIGHYRNYVNLLFSDAL